MINENNYRNEAHKAFDNAYPDFFKAFPPELLRLANTAFDFAYGYGRAEGRAEGRTEGRTDHFADVNEMVNALSLADRLTDKEREKIKLAYKKAYSHAFASTSCIDRQYARGRYQVLREIFGKELFKDEEK